MHPRVDHYTHSGPGRIEGMALWLLPLMRALLRIMPPSSIIYHLVSHINVAEDTWTNLVLEISSLSLPRKLPSVSEACLGRQFDVNSVELI